MEKTSLGGVDHHYSQSSIRLSMIERVVNRILFKLIFGGVGSLLVNIGIVVVVVFNC